MKKEEWKKIIESWSNSKKKKDLKEKIKRKMSDKELLIVIQDLIEYDNLTEEEKTDLDFLEGFLIFKMSKKQVYEDFVVSVARWCFFLLKHQKKENYEICALIMKCINIEEREIMRILSTYFNLDMEDIILIKSTFKKSLEELNKYENDQE